MERAVRRPKGELKTKSRLASIIAETSKELLRTVHSATGQSSLKHQLEGTRGGKGKAGPGGMTESCG